MTAETHAEWIVEQGGERLDRYLAQRLTTSSRSALQKHIAVGHILVNGRPVKASYTLQAGDTITGVFPAPVDNTPQPEQVALDIVYEDDDMLVINKPAGLAVHPGAGRQSGTLVNALLGYVDELAAEESDRPGVVHRLDQDTSGLILVAKSDQALAQLQKQFRERQVEKIYLTLVHGDLQPPQGIIDAPIGRNPHQRKRMAVVAHEGRPARTAYQVREYLGDYTLLEAKPETGRTHQIRVHLAAIGYPVVGDKVYGQRRRALGLARQFLHAWQLTVTLPSSGERRTFIAPLPEDLQQVLDGLHEGKDAI